MAITLHGVGLSVSDLDYSPGGRLRKRRLGNGAVTYYCDWLGSTFQLTDAAEDVTDTYRYNAWGEVLPRVRQSALRVP